MRRHAKAIVALVLALATWGVTASAEDSAGGVSYTGTEQWGALVALGTAAGVWLADNGDDEPTEGEDEPGT